MVISFTPLEKAATPMTRLFFAFTDCGIKPQSVSLENSFSNGVYDERYDAFDGLYRHPVKKTTEIAEI
jgi:hypothetical protein